MQVVRDLVRDLVGILFPGGLLVILVVWFFLTILVAFYPLEVTSLLDKADNWLAFALLLIFSYVAGQILRIKTLEGLDKKATEEYRKKRIKNKPELENMKFEELTKRFDEAEKNYLTNNDPDDLKNMLNIHQEYNNTFDSEWEYFPYPYTLKGRRHKNEPKEYNNFYKKYDKQNITNNHTFYHFCKSVFYERSPSFKEEVLRQESLVRLLAGIYYVSKFAIITNVIVGIFHLLFTLSCYTLKLILSSSNKCNC